MTAWIHHFACLDELIQVIYQSVDKLVVISRVVDDAWTVHLGLSGLDGRWWRGTWTEDDVVQQTVCALISAFSLTVNLRYTGHKALRQAVASFRD